MEKQYSRDDLALMQQLRRVFDPRQQFNPHKIFPGGKRCMDFTPRKQVSA